MLPFVANSLWFLSCLPEARRFHHATRHVEITQTEYLLALLKRNAETDFGQTHGFGTIRNVQDFQERVPLSTFEDYQKAIAALGQGQPKVLTAEPVTLFEPTSGSTGATKLIPYTAALQADFQRGIAPWIADLFRHNPHLMNGRAYWALSPVTQKEARTNGGIPIGFEDDGVYLGRQSGLVRSVMAVPSAVKFISDMESFRYVTLLFLLRTADLTLISVWNPTFLTLLVEPLAQWWQSLATDIERGTITPPHVLEPRIHHLLQAELRPNPPRATEIRTIFQSHQDAATYHKALWQKLRLISCWTDGNATPYAQQVATLFPNATIQGKGLIATEGFISLPLVGKTGTALAIRSHFFEFLPNDDATHRPLLAHELEKGELYEVVITTGGGLYRYRMNDIVEAVGFYHQCPLIKFIGKSALVSDWFGEKLNERHIREVVTEVCARYGIPFTFAMMAYHEEGGGYGLYLEEQGERGKEKGENGEITKKPGMVGHRYAHVPCTHRTSAFILTEGRPALFPSHKISEEIEEGLQDNFHYRYCRQLGQLQAVRIYRIEGDALAAYQARCIALGQRAGDIKPTFLHRASGWSSCFRGAWMQ